MRAYTAKYRLRNGARGTLTIIARDSSSAVVAVLDTFPDQVLSVSSRPAIWFVGMRP